MSEQYTRLFFDEAYANGFLRARTTVDFFKTTDNRFFKNFQDHLHYYERHLFLQPSNIFYKVNALLMYHLERGEPLERDASEWLEYYLQALPSTRDYALGVNELPSYYSFVESYRAYVERFGDTNALIEGAIQFLVPRNSGFLNPVENFVAWQYSIYGLPVLTQELLLREAALYVRPQRRPSTDRDTKPDWSALISFFLRYFQDLLRIDLGEIAVIDTPPYLREVSPTASAYTFDRLLSTPRQVVFINLHGIRSPGKLMLALFHEVFGHLLHDALIAVHCADPIKKLPAISGYAMYEGFALLAEDFFAERMIEKDTRNDFMRAFPDIFTGEDSFVDIANEYSRFRLVRYLRYIFEIDIYQNEIKPDDAVKNIAGTFSLSLEELQSDLFSFLPLPGYASSYIGSYSILKKRGTFGDPDFRKEIGWFGLDFPIVFAAE